MIVVLPMAGRGSRFRNQGYETPKPFIEVLGKPMFVWALESLTSSGLTESIEELYIIVLEEDSEKNNLIGILETVPFKVHVITIHEVTEGQLSTVLKAKDFLLKRDRPLLIVPSDTIVQHDDFDVYGAADGIISVIPQKGDHWSFAKFNTEGLVSEVAEKVRISDYASTGWYFFKSSVMFCEFAEHLIASGKKTKGEFYIMPMYQLLIDNDKKITACIAQKMYDLGTPEAKTYFESLEGKA
jgi:UDP-N-acetylglucosamine diphosphorylase / glucose-1-phosphate thymidylyltransferase / UDP-N-acetylgalactosamine diphosphorylase / glucosamine-1-phosphate N-acetyltransferase / galactosamine-1-phosphate N-acetyltransferase